MMSSLSRCKLIRCLVRRIHRTSSPLLPGQALGRFCFPDIHLRKDGKLDFYNLFAYLYNLCKKFQHNRSSFGIVRLDEN